MSSVVTKECDHEPLVTQEKNLEYRHIQSGSDKCIVLDLHRLVGEMTECVKEASKLCRHMASKVILFSCT